MAAAALSSAVTLDSARAAAAECHTVDRFAAVGGAAVAEEKGFWGALVSWMMEGTAEAGVGWGLPGGGGPCMRQHVHLLRVQTGNGWGGLGGPLRGAAAAAVSHAAYVGLLLRRRQCGDTPSVLEFW